MPADLTGVPSGAGLALGIPAYFHPAVEPADWDALAQPGRPVRAVVFNVADGPGAALDGALRHVACRAAAAGAPVIGYVDTAYGTRPLGELIAELDRYRAWYPVRGFFLDRAATAAALLPWYEQLAAAARRPGELLVLNHGAYPDPGYAQLADALGVFEGPWAAYATVEAPPWAWRYAPQAFWHLVYDTPGALLGDALLRAAACNAGTVYVTDGYGSNPWGSLPSYFEALESSVRR